VGVGTGQRRRPPSGLTGHGDDQAGPSARAKVAGFSIASTAAPVCTSFIAALCTAPALTFFASVPALAASISRHNSLILYCWPGVATRRHARAAEPVGGQVAAAASSTSKSAISRRFVAQTRTALAELLSRDLSGLDVKVLMVDGEHLADRCCMVALAITADGAKVPVGLWDGATENKTVVRVLLADLVSRGPDATARAATRRRRGSPCPAEWPGAGRGAAPAPGPDGRMP
jgi:hypothetical protein